MGETAKVMDQGVKAMVDREGMGMEWYRMRNVESRKSSGNGKRHVGQFINKVTNGVKKKDMKGCLPGATGSPDRVNSAEC